MYKKTREKIATIGNGVRWLIAFPLTLIVTALVAAAILITTASLLLSDADNPKFWIASSGIYTEGVDVAFDVALERQRDAHEATAGEMPGEQPSFDEVLAMQPIPPEDARRALKDVVTPVYVQEQVEGVIDAFYAFARRETPEPNVRIDVAPIRERGRDALGSIFKARVSGLPECTADQAANVEEMDIFSEDACLPPGIEREQVNAMIDAELDKLPLIEQDILTLDDIPDVDREAFARVPFLFGLMRAAPAILALVLLVLTLLLLLLVPHRRSKGLVVGLVYGLPGITAFGLAVSLRQNGPRIFQEYGYERAAEISSEAAAVASRAAMAMLEDISGTLAIVAGATILLGIIGALIAFRHPL